MFSCPTVTRTIRGAFTVKVDANGDAGALVFPNVIASTALWTGTSTDFSTLSYGDNTTSASSRWGVDPTAFAGSMSNYRIVGYGVRVTGLSSMTNTSGKFIVGAYPIQSNFDTKDFPVGGITGATNASMTKVNTFAQWGIPSSGGALVPSALVNYPGTRVISALEFTENEFEVNPRLSSPESMNFRPAGDSLFGYNVVNSAAINDTIAGNAQYLALNGHEAVFIYYTGGVASTSTFDLEIIYHLEGKPNLSGASDAVVTATVGSGLRPSPAKPLGMLKVIEEAVKQPVVKRVIEDAATFIHPMLGRVAGAVLSLF